MMSNTKETTYTRKDFTSDQAVRSRTLAEKRKTLFLFLG